MTADTQKLRNAFGMFATGVTIVTTLDSAGKPVGFTANSFTSVSLDPAILLVCMSQKSRSFTAMTQNTGFAVNILAHDQIPICENFSQSDKDRFANSDWHTGPSGYPLIKECSAWFDCTRRQIINAGDHIVLLGNVTGFDCSEKPPLIMCQSKFQT